MTTVTYIVLLLSLLCILLFSIQLAWVSNGLISALGYALLFLTLIIVAYFVFFSILPISVSRLLLTGTLALVAIVITFRTIQEVLPDPSLDMDTITRSLLAYSAILIAIVASTYFIIQRTDNKIFLSLIVLVAMVSFNIISKYVIDWFKPSSDVSAELVHSSAQIIFDKFCSTGANSTKNEKSQETECGNLKFSVQKWAIGPTMVISRKVFLGKIEYDQIDKIQTIISAFISKAPRAYKISMRIRDVEGNREIKIIQLETRFRLPAKVERVDPFIQNIEKLSQEWRSFQPNYSNIN